MFNALEFGPNATWWNFPKTKQIFMSAKRDDLQNLKDVVDQSVNLNAYGTSRYWTPLHVACFYGSKKVAKYLTSLIVPRKIQGEAEGEKSLLSANNSEK